MKIKFNKYNESIVDKMTPKSKEEIMDNLGMDKDLSNKYMRFMWDHTKKELEEKFEDIRFHKMTTVYTTYYYITDAHDDEENLYKIKEVINEYGMICINSTYNGHSALKIIVNR